MADNSEGALGIDEVGGAPEQDIGKIYHEHVGFAWRLMCHLGVRRADVPDLVQEVFVTVHRRLGAVEVQSSLRAWIYGICVRRAANYRRRASNTRELLVSEPPDRCFDDSERASAKLDLLRALQLLDEQQRAVFLLYEVEGLSMPEVAEALGCPISTAYSRLYRAQRTVKSAFNEQHATASARGGRRE
jgi:RNA polymerase sigma-70 factor (ECF subfamily)